MTMIEEVKAVVPNKFDSFEDSPEFWRNLAGRVVRNSYPTKRKPRWVVVMERTAHGSTYSKELCRYFGLDPDEKKK